MMQVVADVEDEEKLYKQLETEVKKRKANVEVIYQLQEITLKQRRATIERSEESEIKNIIHKFPFLSKETSVSKN